MAWINEKKDIIFERVRAVRQRIATRAERSGRDPASITLVAVSKTFGPEVITAAYEAGIRHFGENRVQEAIRKIPWCPGDIIWHMVGHLQTNKVRHAVRAFHWIHSIDRFRLVETFNRVGARIGFRLEALVQVNIAGEKTKSGCHPDEALDLVRAVIQSPYLHFRGLMTIPPYHPDPEASRPYYRRLRELGERILRDLRETGYEITEMAYSMGMSHDFEVAIEEGATLIRVGQAIFGPREP